MGGPTGKSRSGQPRRAPGGLARAQPRKLPARFARRGARHGGDVGDEVKPDALVGDAARDLGQRIGLVEHDGVNPPPPSCPRPAARPALRCHGAGARARQPKQSRAGHTRQMLGQLRPLAVSRRSPERAALGRRTRGSGDRQLSRERRAHLPGPDRGLLNCAPRPRAGRCCISRSSATRAFRQNLLNWTTGCAAGSNPSSPPFGCSRSRDLSAESIAEFLRDSAQCAQTLLLCKAPADSTRRPL